MNNPKTPLKISDKFVTFTPEQSLDALHQHYKSWTDWHDKLTQDIEAENSEPIETKTDYCARMGFDM